MKTVSSRHLLTASGLALLLAMNPATAQQPPAAGSAADSQPLTAPDSAARQQRVMPESFADLVEQVSPAVVNITTTATVATPLARGPQLPEGSPFSDLFREFGFPGFPPGREGGPFGGPMTEQRSNALGSGFVVSPEGLIVTNNHVIDGADEIEVEFFSGEKLPAKVVGRDDKTDIAVLKVESTQALPFVKFGDSDKARVGDWVLALGNPLGQGFSASTGIVSARNRALSGTYDDFIQTDAAINRGNSGGPLFNMDGEVIGVNTAILSPNGGSIGIGFSMASNVVSKVVEQLEQFGETRRGWLGVKIQPVTPDIAESLGLGTAAGAMVTDVPTGPAADAGMKAGDVIIRFAGGEVKDPRDLVRRVADAPVGEAVDVTVQRDGKQVELKVTLGRRELAEGTGAGSVGSATASASDLMGMTLAPLTPEIAAELGVSRDMQGLVVQSVDPSGAAADKGLTPGDVITEAGQKPVASLNDLEARIKEARDAGRKSILVMVRRAGEPRFVALPVQ
ncbi:MULTISPECIES: DegQ family serine endoprotease [unclassified Paracoccus (in: a-proteobacteria)]|uniref:DegQ family serine endoprotease n=1 Tax=unclassified Paracoccus (in: a-proteobacteria) TaxID=2688777 RepID=UPI0012B2F603|nr:MULTISPECIES: DegQ family serine endoprotease [unclassified Paracoccus (in: a-proteobacteria)]UXU74774.1 DegQ family serine endoprotease [Paracoccus sp. SMMA_5]UXU80671.1 DegQ family serine endoprotease [Paracoccus sp. SMMA_5_TC]